jgi:predicted DNA-binding transcriptional regulator AlpA
MQFLSPEDEDRAFAGLSRSTRAKMRCAGTGPRFYKIGRRCLYTMGDIEAWIQSRARTSTWPTEAANDNTATQAA